MKEFGDTTVNPNILIKFHIVVSRSGYQSFETLRLNKINDVANFAKTQIVLYGGKTSDLRPNNILRSRPVPPVKK